MFAPFRRSFDRRLRPHAPRSSSSRRRAALGRRPLVEDLEGRQMLSMFTVTNTNDSGAGSLRQAVIDSNSTADFNAITFNIPGSGVQTINLRSALPPLTQPVTIDGTTQPGSDGQQPPIQIDGTNAGPGAVGLDVEASASGSSFHGLAITDFSVGGMLVVGASNVAIVNDDIGLVQNSSGVFVHGNGDFGVELVDGASNNDLAGDVISGQAGYGVVFSGSGTMNNLVEQCEIGTDPSGMTGVDSANQSLANTWSGVVIAIGASDNLVSDDVISNNGQNGVVITGTGTTGNVVEGSFIGTNGQGSAPLPNYNGVLIQGGASDNTIGALAVSGPSNVISGNTWDGVHIVDSGTTGNVVEGNYIGIHPMIPSDGIHATELPGPLGNGQSGVAIFAGAIDNTVGGTVAGAGNVISGNGQNGVYLSDSGTTGNVVAGDFIGTDPNGWRAIPNYNGVLIQDGAADNTIGGTSDAARDVISGNNWDGVHMVNGASDNVVEGDFLGVNADGTAALGNAQSGVAIFAGASDNTIGGTASGSGDVISGNDSNGVYISDSGTTGNVVAGDLIGTDSAGMDSVPNHVGVLIQNGAAQNTIGGITSTVSDVISGNNWDGVQIAWGATSNVVEGDFIGLTSNGNSASATEPAACRSMAARPAT
jgi:titin